MLIFLQAINLASGFMINDCIFLTRVITTQPPLAITLDQPKKAPADNLEYIGYDANTRRVKLEIGPDGDYITGGDDGIVTGVGQQDPSGYEALASVKFLREQLM